MYVQCTMHAVWMYRCIMCVCVITNFLCILCGCMYTSMYVCTYVYTYVCMYVCMSVLEVTFENCLDSLQKNVFRKLIRNGHLLF